MKSQFTLLFLAICSIFFAQNVQVKVINDQNKPIANVLVENLRTQNHGHTNGDGLLDFQDLQMGDTLSVSKPNFYSQKIKLTAPELTVILQEKAFSIKEIELIGNKNPFNEITKIDLFTQPVVTSQELLRKVPGLFIGQHAGGGKAEQMFLRGYDLDHGTDIAISVDGMPVNMVSHAHGQGYADLHFVIPETVDKIDFEKGSYNAAIGNMATAGNVQLLTKNELSSNSATVEAGQFNTYRMLVMANIFNKANQNAYFASDYRISDGFFENSQNFSRFNLFGKYTATFNERDQLSFSFSHFSSSWDASGQIPDRAVDRGMIGFFGAIDPYEGGATSRQNINLVFKRKLSDASQIEFGNFFSKYHFNLFSNFTFFLEDEENGDQIQQKENRSIFGSYLHFNKKFDSKIPIAFRSGMGYRMDDVKDLQLNHTKNRNEILERKAFGDVQETNFFAFADWEIKLGKLFLKPGIRLDVFRNDYTNFLSTTYDRKVIYKSILSPKLAINYDWNATLQSFLKLGKGFHSNDTRVVVQQSEENVLPATYNADAGMVWKVNSNLILNAAFWSLFSEQEFVYVGDAAIVEPSGKSVRKGLDLGMRLEFAKLFYLNADYTYTHARMIDEPEDANFVPLAPKNTLLLGLSMKEWKGFSAGVSTRYLGSRPANEDNSIVAKGYTVSDANINYKIGKWRFGIIAENLFDVRWKETQFATESRLKMETEPVNEIHFTPGTPLNVRASVGYAF